MFREFLLTEYWFIAAQVHSIIDSVERLGNLKTKMYPKRPAIAFFSKHQRLEKEIVVDRLLYFILSLPHRHRNKIEDTPRWMVVVLCGCCE